MPDTVAQASAYLHHLAFESANPERLAEFYRDIMQMDLTKIGDDEFRCEGPARRLIAVRGEDRRLSYAGLAVRDADGLKMIRDRAESEGVEILPSPSPYFRDGAFGVRDYDGNLILFGLAKPEHVKKMGWPRPDHSAPIWGPTQHLTLRSTDLDGFVDFYHRKLGFRMVDRILLENGDPAAIFITSNHEHHTIGVFRGQENGVDHHSYEAGEWAYLRDWCEHFSRHGVRLAWGPGRHGAGHNLFAFIEDCDGAWIEISAELEVIHDRPCEEWPAAGNSNTWGDQILRK